MGKHREWKPGVRVGMLTLVGRYIRPHEPKPVTYWWCLCDCGTYRVVRQQNLTGTTRSCGCWRREACRIRERKKVHPVYGKIVSYYKRNAKVRGHEWSLSADDVTRMVTSNCYYCGAAPTLRDSTTYGNLVANGIDRTDNSKGYVLSNCVPCCATCNRAKLAMSLDQFKDWVTRVYNHAQRGWC